VGSYTLTATVGAQGSTAPTGTVKFIDTTYGNAVLVSSTLTASNASAGLTQGASFTTSGQIDTAATGDFNGDGYPDLALITDANTLVIELGSSSGAYTALTAMNLANSNSDSWPVAVAVGDFNGDGNQDLSILMGVGGSSYSLVTLLGKGNGTFTKVSSSPSISNGATELVVGDFNNDGNLDLAVASPPSSSIILLKGKGDGTFSTSTISLTGSVSPYSLAAGDFNGDGNLDLAVLSNGNPSTVVTLLGRGNGSFTQVSSATTVGSYSTEIVAADFNGDGNLGLAVMNQGSNTVSVLKGKGNGTFSAVTLSSISSPIALAVGDFNGDGTADLAVIQPPQYTTAGTQASASVLILAGNGVGGFTSSTTSMASGSYWSAALAANLNADGATDLFLLGEEDDSGFVVQTLFGQNKVSTAAVRSVAVTGAGPHKVAVSYGGSSVYNAAQSATTSLYGPAPTPTFSLKTGAYSGTQTVTISDTAAGATIYYTTDGSTPDENSQRYLGPVVIGSTTTLKAIATSSAYGTSATASATYTFK
jgi:hypothetical protein